ncbi:CoA-transferase [Streptomyces sp. NPDC004542]|uniref:CoA transferase subunit A n=1 Tax=Streptomyces sp. NPDC004542 TaxID=3154281 RepID=UPI0033AF4A0E
MTETSSGEAVGTPHAFTPPQRRSKEISLEEAGALIAQRTRLAFGNEPMALVRAAIRAGAKDLTVIPPVTTSLSTDLLIAAGAVDTLYVCYIGFETLGMAPAFRRAAESNALNIVEADEIAVILGTRTAAGGMPFAPVKNIYEATDLPRLNPNLKRVVDPFTGEEMTAIPALRSEICLIHAQEADVYGNAVCVGSNNQEADKALASDFVIVQADRIVSTERIKEQPYRTTLPSNLVHAVVHAPFGAHPLVSGRQYQMDVPHVRTYLDMVKAGKAAEYLERYVYGPENEWEYLDAIGARNLLALQRNI